MQQVLDDVGGGCEPNLSLTLATEIFGNKSKRDVQRTSKEPVPQSVEPAIADSDVDASSFLAVKTQCASLYCIIEVPGDGQCCYTSLLTVK